MNRIESIYSQLATLNLVKREFFKNIHIFHSKISTFDFKLSTIQITRNRVQENYCKVLSKRKFSNIHFHSKISTFRLQNIHILNKITRHQVQKRYFKVFYNTHFRQFFWNKFFIQNFHFPWKIWDFELECFRFRDLHAKFDLKSNTLDRIWLSENLIFLTLWTEFRFFGRPHTSEPSLDCQISQWKI